MKFWTRLIDRINGARIGAAMGQSELENSADFIADAIEDRQVTTRPGDKLQVKENIWSASEATALAELELSLEDTSWRELNGPMGMWQFSRWALNRMIALSRVMYLMNPLIKRAITVQELYVWGSGCEMKAKSPAVQEVLDDFYKDPKNQTVIGEAWPEREREQRIDGNQFFIFFTNKLTGTARVRLLSVEQVEDIITDPEDSKHVWFYKRIVGSSPGYDSNGTVLVPANGLKYILHPDIDYRPKFRPISFANIEVKWNAPILHVKTGGLSSMKFGMPECFSAINWARAYKKILENFATILQAYARIAMKISGLPGKAGAAAAKSKLGTAINGISNLVDTNPPNNTGSIMALSGGVDIQPVKTARSTTGPDEARALRSMVASGTDTPEHFFGDSDIGNFATSKTLDRPTELKMVSRQTMWENVQHHMNRYLLEISVRAPFGKLRKAGWKADIRDDIFDGTLIVRLNPPNDDDKVIEVRFPAIIQADIVERVRAVVQAATLGGSKAEGIISDRKLLFKMLMVALGQDNADQLSDELYPQAIKQGFIDPKEELAIEQKRADAAMISAKQPKASPTAPVQEAVNITPHIVFGDPKVTSEVAEQAKEKLTEYLQKLDSVSSDLTSVIKTQESTTKHLDESNDAHLSLNTSVTEAIQKLTKYVGDIYKKLSEALKDVEKGNVEVTKEVQSVREAMKRKRHVEKTIEKDKDGRISKVIEKEL